MRISVTEKYLSFNGEASDAFRLVEDIRQTYYKAGDDMPKVTNDFVFSLEVALQQAGILDENFEPIPPMSLKRAEALISRAYQFLAVEMEEEYPSIDLDEPIGNLAEALAILQKDKGSFSE